MWGYWEDYPKEYRNGQYYAVIDGRLYSEHACDMIVPSYLRRAGSIERNDGRGIPPTYVEEAIRYGSPTPDGEGKTCYTYGTFSVVVNDFDAVVTVYKTH